MHPGQIFVITCPTVAHNSIRNSLTYGGEHAPAAPRKQRGKSQERHKVENRAYTESQHSPGQGSKPPKPSAEPCAPPLAPHGQIHRVCSHARALCTGVSSSRWAHLGRERF